VRDQFLELAFDSVSDVVVPWSPRRIKEVCGMALTPKTSFYGPSEEPSRYCGQVISFSR